MFTRAYHATGEPAPALLAYQRLRVALDRELGVQPDARTQDLHIAILRQNAAVAAGPTARLNATARS